MDKSESGELSIVVENIAIGLTGEILIVRVIPVESEGTIVGDLILVRDTEFIRESDSWDMHERIVVGEFSGGEIDGISFFICITCDNSRISILVLCSFIFFADIVVVWRRCSEWIVLEIVIYIGKIDIVADWSANISIDI